VDAESLHRLKPELILLENAGYGVSGPKAQRGGFDMILLALCGHEYRAGGEGNPPGCYATTVIDLATGFLGSIAALMAQFIKQRTGAGAVIETSLLNTGLFLLSELVQSPSGEFLPIATLNGQQTGFHPAERLYQAADGQWVAVAARGQAMASRLLSALGLDGQIRLHRDDWAAPEADLIATAVARRDSASLLTTLASASVWATLCRSDARQVTLNNAALREAGAIALFDGPRYGEVRQIGPLFSLSKAATRGLGEAPEIGQHTSQLLSELGYSDEQIAALIAEKVVVQSQTG
jgi:crotonobetainyl-CoA:carnitine CoA-transferase CaiB-like acyl-CoA transferase